MALPHSNWTAAVSGDTSNGADWSGGEPNSGIAATIDIKGAAYTVTDSIAFTANTLVVNSADVTFQQDADGSLDISRTFQIRAGTVILDGTNDIGDEVAPGSAGGLTVLGGLLEIGSSGALGTNSFNIQNGAAVATADVTLALDFGFFHNADFSAASGVTADLGGAHWEGFGALVFGAPDDTGTVVFHSSADSLVDTPSLTSVEVSAGTLEAGDNHFSLLSRNVTQFTVDSGATFDTGGHTITVVNLEGGGTVADSGAGGTLAIHGGNFTGTFTGPLTLEIIGAVAFGNTGAFAGEALLERNATLHVTGSEALNVSFDGAARLLLNNPALYTGSVSDFGAGDTIDVRDIGFGPGTVQSYDATTHELTVTDGVHTREISILGSYVTDNFILATDHKGGIDITFSGVDAVHPTLASEHPAVFDFG